MTAPGPTRTLYPEAAWLPVDNHGGPMTADLGLVLHVQQGDGSLAHYFDTPDVQKSSTWWIAKTGRVEQYVRAGVQAWAQCAGNATYNSVETEGFDTEPLTVEQLHALAALYAWGATARHWKLAVTNMPGVPGLGTHAMGREPWCDHPGCPGQQRTAQRASVIALADALVNPPAPLPGGTGMLDTVYTVSQAAAGPHAGKYIVVGDRLVGLTAIHYAANRDSFPPAVSGGYDHLPQQIHVDDPGQWARLAPLAVPPATA